MNERPKMKVLIVEDNALNLELAKDLLEASGQTVYQAHSAEEGLRLAQSTAPDVVLMDLGLPGIDGLSATKALRLNSVTKHLPIIALTAHAMKGDEQCALEAGCDGYLPKPIDTRTFVARIMSLVQAAKSSLP
jgi:CheY-like chemotaxis protein